MDSILIIDDDKELCELVGELLREEETRPFQSHRFRNESSVLN